MPNTKHIDLLQIIREGTIGPLRLGDTWPTVMCELGAPTDTGYEIAILKYGTFEFSFFDTKLHLFHCDEPFGPWDFGDLVTLDPWVLAFGKPLADVVAACRNADLPNVLVKHPVLVDQIHILFESSAMLSFDLEEPDANGEPTLCSFNLTALVNSYYANTCHPV